ncbi:glyoxalase [Candidatus Protofrankia californiensis]|uniref:glyoxalase n=1 Tax=Candidatus Protofrankia californiensis TaxID=1839754 RepID=UPI001F494A8C|nr:glyoxalase [Candidatus Protofrankia californiensis]
MSASIRANTATEPFAGVTGLHHIQLAVPAGCEDACRAFWVDVVGLTEVSKPAPMAARGGAWFRGPGFELHVGVTADFTPASKAHPAILVNDIDALAVRLADASIAPVWAHDFPGHRHFYVADPVGNRIEFLMPDAVACSAERVSGRIAEIPQLMFQMHERRRRRVSRWQPELL